MKKYDPKEKLVCPKCGKVQYESEMAPRFIDDVDNPIINLTCACYWEIERRPFDYEGD